MLKLRHQHQEQPQQQQLYEILVPYIYILNLDGRLGFEPKFPDSKSGVLPLDDRPLIKVLCKTHLRLGVENMTSFLL